MATGEMRPPGLVAKSKGLRISLAWFKSGSAICQLVPSGMFPGHSEPRFPDL